MEVVKGPDIVQEELFSREALFSELVKQYQTPLLRMCSLYLRDRSLAEDAVQETFLKAYKAAAHFRGECSEKTWLMRIAMNTCHDMKRSGWFKHMDRWITPEGLQEKESEGTEPFADEAFTAAELTEEIARLPQKQREVVLLYYYQGMTVYEIGEVLGINHASVSHRLKRAKEKLRIAMKGAYFNE